MAKLHFINGAFYGKGGTFVGSKWKNLTTVRPYVAPSNPNTPAQQTQRTHFRDLQKQMQKIANLIKGYTTLEKERMPLLSALMKYNKYEYQDPVTFFNPQKAIFTKGNGTRFTIQQSQVEPTVLLLEFYQTAGEKWTDKARLIMLILQNTPEDYIYSLQTFEPQIVNNERIFQVDTNMLPDRAKVFVWTIDRAKGILQSSDTMLAKM